MGHTAHRQGGFSLVDVMLVVMVLGVLGAVGVPNLRSWQKNYQLKSAATDLYSHFQFAKIGAVKQNRPWTVVLNPAGTFGYEVRNGDGRAVKRIDFGAKYKHDILFGDPTATVRYDTATFTVSPNGSSTIGYVYLSNTEQAGYYRVGFALANGLARLQKWQSAQAQWE
ncbi:MAG: GspH/FimT family pseudopilin [Candidatus Tectimicrobiota bacterium]